MFFSDNLEVIAPSWRFWRVHHFFALWFVFACSLPTYMLGSQLLLAGLAWWQTIIIIMSGAALSLFLTLLLSQAAARYGVNFPLMTRCVFGLRGAKLICVFRAFFGCVWFGIQLWLAATALAILLQLIFKSPFFASHFSFTAHQWFSGSFLFLLIINLLMLKINVERFQHTLMIYSLFLVSVFLLLLCYFWFAKNLNLAFSHFDYFTGNGPFKINFLNGIAMIVGFLAPIVLSSGDYARFAQNENHQRYGQFIGGLLAISLISIVGLSFAVLTYVDYEKLFWNPLFFTPLIFPKIISIFILLLIIISSLLCNFFANTLPSVNCLINLFPQKINAWRACLLLSLIAMILRPWFWLEDTHHFGNQWLNIAALILPSIMAVMICDYFCVRRGHILVNDLFQKQGAYWYLLGINWLAFFAIIGGLVINLPLFFLTFGILLFMKLPPWLIDLERLGWFSSFLLSFILYYFLMKIFGSFFQRVSFSNL